MLCMYLLHIRGHRGVYRIRIVVGDDLAMNHNGCVGTYHGCLKSSLVIVGVRGVRYTGESVWS